MLIRKVIQHFLFKLLLKRSSLFFVHYPEFSHMKTIIFILVIFAGIIQACQKKTLPTITTRTSDLSKPVVNTFNVIPDTATGKMIFANRCSRCHALPEPVQFTTQRWEGILARMIPRARLDKEQEIHITAFIKANCTK